MSATTHDFLLGGRIRLAQPARGYRAGVDAVLLGCAISASPRDRLLELGCGVGAALLIAAHRLPECEFVGIERDEGMHSLAVENISANAADGRVTALLADGARRGLPGAPYDHVFSNPPFFDDTSLASRLAPERKGAWISDAGLARWIDASLAALKPKGTLTLIHRADRLADILAAFGGRAAGTRVRTIRPYEGADASRVLVRTTKTSKAPLTIGPDIILHPEDKTAKYRPDVEAILRGEGELSL
jgi:tRNA1(Val) A37 N6-methylase TrmN6